GTQLNLASRGGRFGDSSELRGINETVRSAEIRVIQSIKELPAKLEFHLLRQMKLAREREIQGLHSWPIKRISPHIAEGVRRRGGERSRIEPFAYRPGAVAEDRLAAIVRPNRVFPQDGSRIGGVAEDGNGEGEAGLHLIHGREL